MLKFPSRAFGLLFTCIHLFFRILLFPFRILMALGSTVLAITTVIFFLLSITLPILTTLSDGVYHVASWVGEQVISVPDIVKHEGRKAKGKLSETQATLASERAAAKEVKLAASKTSAELGAALERTTALQAELAAKTETRVVYRSEKRLLSEAVADASARVARRIRTMLTADISSMAGQAVPYIGAAVVISSIGYDAWQSCEMIKDLHDLDVAFNPDHAINVNEVCGMHVPTLADISASAGNAADTTITWLRDTIVFWK